MRSFLIAGVLGACALGASAQTEVVKLSEARRLDCLVKPGSPPRYPEHNKLDRSEGSMRLLLKFTQPDAKPAVEVLFNSAREDMQDLVERYVAGYRLPCLKPEDGEVRAVQEFNFSNTDRDPTPMSPPPDAQGPLCVVMPRQGLDYRMGFGRSEVEHLIAHITFKGDGQQPPDVTFAYVKASKSLQDAVREWVAGYRMPCRTPQDKPRTIEQSFSMHPDNKQRYGFKRERFSLREFLGLMKEPGKRPAYFDLNTMACPFKVDFTIGGEGLPHNASVSGPIDPNRVGFLHWLKGLQFDFKSDDVANDLWGTRLQVDVPCGVINFKGETGASAE